MSTAFRYHYSTGGGYYRIGFRKPPNIIMMLITINTIVFLFEYLNPNVAILTFGLVPPLITQKLYLWQFFTYMFLHGNFLHLFFNMFALYIFGHDLLLKWGHRKFLSYYFLTGLGAGFCAYLFTNAPTIGASGAIYGLLLAYGITFPNRILLLFFFIPMKAKFLVFLFGFIEFFASITSRADGIAHTAHLGGMAVGAILLLAYRWKAKMQKPHSGDLYDTFTILRPQEPEDVDKILDKILKHGVGSLTPKERSTLMKAGKFFIHHSVQNDRDRKNR